MFKFHYLANSIACYSTSITLTCSACVGSMCLCSIMQALTLLPCLGTHYNKKGGEALCPHYQD